MKKLYHFGILFLALLVLSPVMGNNDTLEAEEDEVLLVSKRKWLGVAITTDSTPMCPVSFKKEMAGNLGLHCF